MLLPLLLLLLFLSATVAVNAFLMLENIHLFVWLKTLGTRISLNTVIDWRIIYADSSVWVRETRETTQKQKTRAKTQKKTKNEEKRTEMKKCEHETESGEGEHKIHHVYINIIYIHHVLLFSLIRSASR